MSFYLPSKAYQRFKPRPDRGDVRRDLHECRIVGAKLSAGNRRSARARAAAIEASIVRVCNGRG